MATGSGTTAQKTKRATKKPTKLQIEAKGSVSRTINSFRVKIVNKTGTDVIFTSTNYYGERRIPIRDNGSYVTPFGWYFIEGERIVAAFDDFTEAIVCFSKITINDKTVITLRVGQVATEQLP